MQGKSRNQAFKGHEIFQNELRMYLKMCRETALYCMGLQVLLFIGFSIFMVTPEVIGIALKYLAAKVANFYNKNPSYVLFGQTVTAKQLLSMQTIPRMIAAMYGKLYLAGLLSFSGYLAWPLIMRYYKHRASKATQVEHIRGMQLQTESTLREQLEGINGILPFGSIVLPTKYEPEHVFIGGKTRVGKSVTLMQHLDAIIRNGHRAVVHDFKGEYVEKFFRPGRDHILNPLDIRGVQWTIFNELITKGDLSAITGSLIPPSHGEERFWNTAAQDVLRGVMSACYASGDTTNSELWTALTSPIKNIADMCRRTPMGQAGYVYIQDAGSKQAASVIAVLMSYVSWLEFAGDGGFCIRDWLQGGEGIIYLTGRPEVENTLRPYVSLFIDLLGKQYLSMPDDQERRVYFVLDELGNLQKLPTIKRLLTAGGSKGAIVEIGVQDFAAIQKIYGREDAETIYNSCGTNLILNVADPATAKIFSDRFGEYQYWDTSETQSMGPNDLRDGISLVRQKQTERLILPSEIQNLPKLEGYLKLPEHNPAKITVPILEPNNRPTVNDAFLMREGFNLEDLEAREAVVQAQVTAARGLQPPPVPALEVRQEAGPADGGLDMENSF